MDWLLEMAPLSERAAIGLAGVLFVLLWFGATYLGEPKE